MSEIIPPDSDIGELADDGVIVAINALVLHPIGLALYRKQEADGRWVLGGIQNHRSDPEGVYYDPIDAAKLEQYRAILAARAPARKARLGYIIQDLGLLLPILLDDEPLVSIPPTT